MDVSSKGTHNPTVSASHTALTMNDLVLVKTTTSRGNGEWSRAVGYPQ